MLMHEETLFNNPWADICTWPVMYFRWYHSQFLTRPLENCLEPFLFEFACELHVATVTISHFDKQSPIWTLLQLWGLSLHSNYFQLAQRARASLLGTWHIVETVQCPTSTTMIFKPYTIQELCLAPFILCLDSVYVTIAPLHKACLPFSASHFKQLDISSTQFRTQLFPVRKFPYRLIFIPCHFDAETKLQHSLKNKGSSLYPLSK